MIWILAAVLAGVAVAAFLLPLLRPQPCVHGRSSSLRRLPGFGGLDASLRSGHGIGWLAMVAVPVLVLAVYLPIALTDLSSSTSMAREERLEAVVATLQDHLGRSPEDVEGWLVLGQALGHLGRVDEALDAYARAQSLAPEDAMWLDDVRERIAQLATEQ